MILHRDIKPDNLLFDKEGKYIALAYPNINILILGNIKIADFGLSKKASFL